MKSSKFYKYLSIVLILLNVGTLTFFYFTKPPHPPGPGAHVLSKEIGLEGQVKKEVDALESAHHKQKRQLMRRNFELHRQLYEKLDDSTQSAVLLKKIDANHKKIEEMTFQFFEEIAKKCNKAQRKKLDAMIHRSLRMIAGQGPPHR